MAKNEKITKRDYYENIKAVLAGDEVGIAREELIAFCDKELTNLANKSERAKAAAAKKREAGDILTDTVRSVLTEDLQTVPEIVEAIGDENITNAKVIYRLNALFNKGEVRKEVIVASNEEGGRAKRFTAYALV